MSTYILTKANKRLPIPPDTTVLECSNNYEIDVLPELPRGLTHLYCSFNQITDLPALPAGLVCLRCVMNKGFARWFSKAIVYACGKNYTPEDVAKYAVENHCSGGFSEAWLQWCKEGKDEKSFANEYVIFAQSFIFKAWPRQSAA